MKPVEAYFFRFVFVLSCQSCADKKIEGLFVRVATELQVVDLYSNGLPVQQL